VGGEPGKIFNRMDKGSQKGHYFTFPLKFLWFDPVEKEENLNKVIAWSIYKFMIEKCSPGNDKERYKKAQSFLSFHGNNLNSTLRLYNEMNYELTPGDIYTSIKTSYLFEARDNVFPFELLVLLAAVKSVIGHKHNFKKTYQKFLIRRMYGTDKPINRYQFNKLIDNATARGLFALIPAGRGYYVSIRYKSNELREQVKQRIIKYEGKRNERAEASRELMNLRKELRNKYKKTPKPAE
jgi:hypothetical protein